MGSGESELGRRTELPVLNFFSVPMTAPLRWAALRALFPRTTVSRGPLPPPRVLLPILVTLSQSSILGMLACVCAMVAGEE